MDGPVLKYTYSENLEISRLLYTLNRLEWYLNNGYSLDYISFPEGLVVSNTARGVDEEKVALLVKKEYNSNKYKEAAESLDNLYRNYKQILGIFINKISLGILPEIEVVLSRYGIGGSYHLPNKIVCNIAKMYNIGLLRATLHEIIHLHIEPLIKKYQINHWSKESIVNLLFQSAFMDIYKESDTRNNEGSVKQAYDKFFPDIEKIISTVSDHENK